MNIQPEYLADEEKTTESYNKGKEDGWDQGWDIGLKLGRKIEREEIIKSIFKWGFSIEEISKLTNVNVLSIKKITHG